MNARDSPAEQGNLNFPKLQQLSLPPFPLA